MITIVTVLIILWLIGIVTAYTLGGFVHVLLLVAVIVVLVRVIKGEKILK